MKRFLVVAGMLVAMSGVASADIADREHDDSNTNTVVQAIENLNAQIQALQNSLNTYWANQPETGVQAPAPTLFRQCRLVRGLEKCSRKYLKAVN